MPRAPLPRLPLAGVALAAAAGIVVAEYSAPSAPVLWMVTAAGLLLAPWRGGTVPLWVAAAGVFALVHTWQWTDNPARAWAAAVAPEPRPAAVTGVLAAEPREIRPGIWRAPVRVESWRIGGRETGLRGTVVARWRTGETPRYGDRWTIEGTLAPWPPPRNPGQFDAATWWARQGVFLELGTRQPDNARLEARDEGSLVRTAAWAARAWILRTLQTGTGAPAEVQAVIAGITLGAREEGAESLVAAFRQTGTLHLFAVSGLHVGMFGLLLWFLLRGAGFDRRRAILVIIPLLFFYSLVTGAKPSSLRAATMISLALGGFLLDRAPSPGNSLAAAALVLLGYDTNQLFQPGFQLSFCVVSSIILLAPPLDRRWAARWRPDPFLPRRLYSRAQRAGARLGRWTAAALAVSAASWLGSLPLTVGLFHLVPVVAIPVNMLAVPLAFAVLAVSMLALLGGLASTVLATAFNHTNSVLAAALLALVQGAATLPGAWFHVPPAFLQPPVRLTVFDLSTGGAQLLRTREGAWLFDAGTAYDFRAVIEPALRSAGVGRLNALVVTHGDAEHAGGAIDAWRAHQPRRAVDSVLRDRSPARRGWQNTVRGDGGALTLALPGDRFRAGPGTRVVILAPSPAQKSRTADDQAIVARLDTAGFRTLLMSDAGAATEDHLRENAPAELRADIVVFGRHGADLFATSAFLEAVQPRVIILAAPDPFRDGRNEPALRHRLAASGAALFDQATCGAVIVTFKRDHAEVRGFLDGTSTALRPRP
jgi:competence protein ComEC